jgi:hypothetical protein
MDPGEAGEQKDLFLPGFFSGREDLFSSREWIQGEDLFSQEKDYLVYLVYNVI